MLRQVARVATRIVATAAVVAVLLVATAVVAIPAASGGAALTVWTGSMEPDVPRGSMVVVRPVNPFRLEPGDVITYQARPDTPTFVTHRVVEVQEDADPPSVITKGDANPSVDPDPVEMQWIRGKVLVHVPYAGLVGEKVRSPSGITALLVLIGGAVTVGLGRNVVTELRSGRSVDESYGETDSPSGGLEQHPTSAEAGDAASAATGQPADEREEAAHDSVSDGRGQGLVEVQEDTGPPRVITKGDVNPSADSEPVATQQVCGTMLVPVPHVGLVGEKVRSASGSTARLLPVGRDAPVTLGRNHLQRMHDRK
jgi:signal peptidase I